MRRAGGWYRKRFKRQHKKSFNIVFSVLRAVPVRKVQRVSHSNVKAVDKPEDSDISRFVIKFLILLRDNDTVNGLSDTGNKSILANGAIRALDQGHLTFKVVGDLEFGLLLALLDVQENYILFDSDINCIMSVRQFFSFHSKINIGFERLYRLNKS